MPISGRVPPPCTDAASSVPTNGPTQANEASENVRPMSSVPRKPPCREALFEPRQNARRDGDFEGAQQAQAEGDETAREMKPLTQGFEPSCTIPNGPRIAVAARPSPENSTMMPRQKTSACTMLRAGRPTAGSGSTTS